MRITVLCFGILKDLLGAESHQVALADGQTVAAVLRLFERRTSNRGTIWGSIAVAVNREYAGMETVLRDGDEVALLPPVSGGAGGAAVCG